MGKRLYGVIAYLTREDWRGNMGKYCGAWLMVVKNVIGGGGGSVVLG